MSNIVGIISQGTNWLQKGPLGMQKTFADDLAFAQRIGARFCMFDGFAPGGRGNPVKADQMPDQPWMRDLLEQTISRFAIEGIDPWWYTSPFLYSGNKPRICDVETNVSDVSEFTAILNAVPAGVRRAVFDICANTHVTSADIANWKPSGSAPVLDPNQPSPSAAFRYAREWLDVYRNMTTAVETVRIYQNAFDLAWLASNVAIVLSGWWGLRERAVPRELAHRVVIWLHPASMSRLSEWQANGHQFIVYASDYRNNPTYRAQIDAAFGGN